MFYRVMEKEEAIIERFGRFVTVKKKPGLKFNMPLAFRKVAVYVPTNVTQHEACLDAKTRDDVFVTVPTTLQLQVIDSRQFHYNSENYNPEKTYQQALAKIVGAMKQLVANMDFDDLFQARENLGNEVREKVGEDILGQCGLKIVDVIVGQPRAPKSVQEAYNSAKSSEYKAKALVNEAEAERKSTILRAEGRKEELRLVGEGVAQQRAAAIQNIARQAKVLMDDGIPQEAALNTILRVMDMDVLRDLAKGGNVVFTQGDKETIIPDIQAALKGLTKAQPKSPGGPA